MSEAATRKPEVVAIVLAAGASERLGQPKQLLSYNGRTLLQRTVDACLGSKADRVVVVVGAGHEKVSDLIKDSNAATVVNENWQAGIGSSISCGVEAALSLPDSTIGSVIVCVCDQPGLTSEFINHMIDSCGQTTEPLIVAAEYAGTRGVPALFSSHFFDELKKLSHAGAKQIIKSNHAAVCGLPFPEGEVDIDTADDYLRLISDA